MAELHEALKWLSPIDWTDLPVDDLSSFVSEAAEAGELICNSVPPPSSGTSFQSASPSIKEPNTAKSSKDMHNSDARSYPPHEDHEKLQKAWGKPYKMNAKDNPLNVAVYKMAGRDRHGAWFARYSIHEGIGFDKFRRALQREFPHSLSITGGPGAGAVRGLAADRRVEKNALDDARNVEVLQLSAQFPGPTTAREFNTLLITNDDALSEKSAADAGGKKHVPRHHMVISKPVTHPEAPDRSGYVRGQYESVEMIREIPLHVINTASQSTPNLLEPHNSESSSRPQDSAPRSTTNLLETPGKGQNNSANTVQGTHDPELNPVEWIMVTRSDPGGGIPRFLVDRGTPEAMLGDLTKFLNWACAMDEVPDPDADLNEQEQASKENGTQAESSPEKITEQSATTKSGTAPVNSEQPQSGVLSTLGQAIQKGINDYAPAVVSRNVNHYVHFEDAQGESSDSSDESSVLSFLSAEENRGTEDANLRDANAPSLLRQKSTMSEDSTLSRITMDPKDMNHHDREANKAAKNRHKLDLKLAKQREEEEDRYQKTISKDEKEADKARERRDRELKKLEDRHQQAVEKLRVKEEKERKKANERRSKKDDANKLSLVSRERDDFRTQADLSRRENTLLMNQVEQLQHENTLLTTELGKLGGGAEVLVQIREQLANRSRASSLKSVSRASIPAP